VEEEVTAISTLPEVVAAERYPAVFSFSLASTAAVKGEKMETRVPRRAEVVQGLKVHARGAAGVQGVLDFWEAVMEALVIMGVEVAVVPKEVETEEMADSEQAVVRVGQARSAGQEVEQEDLEVAVALPRTAIRSVPDIRALGAYSAVMPTPLTAVAGPPWVAPFSMIAAP
jgi:hypothetical protein